MLSCNLVSSKLLLLFLITFYFSNLIFAQDNNFQHSPPTDQTVVLIQGTSGTKPTIFDSNVKKFTDNSKKPTFSYTILEGKKVISSVQVEEFIPSVDQENYFVSFDVLFRGLSGRAEITINIEYGNKRLAEHSYFYSVVGLVLYEARPNSKQPKIFTGVSGVGTGLVIRDDMLNQNTQKLESLSAVVYEGLSIETQANEIKKEDITISLSSDPSNVTALFPYNPKACLINPQTADSILDSAKQDRCSMGFSTNFDKFHIVLPPRSKIPKRFSLKIDFTWPRIDKLLGSSQEAGVHESQEETSQNPTQLENNRITSLTLKYVPGTSASDPDIQSSSSGPGGRTISENGLENWQLALIVTTAVLIVIALVVLIYCLWYTARLRNDAYNEKPSRLGNLLGLGHVRRQDTNMNNNDGYDGNDEERGQNRDEIVDGFTPVPMPSIDKRYLGEIHSHTRSILLPEPNDIANPNNPRVSRPPAPAVEGLVPLEHHDIDKSVERLHIPKRPARGMDIELSTDESTKTSYDTGDDVTSFGRGMTSIPRDHSNDDGHTREAFDREEWEKCMNIFRGQGGNGNVTDDDVKANSKIQMNGVINEENNNGEGRNGRPMTPNRNGVGAAITRAKQVNLLHGPASLGLVGRNGEPVHGALISSNGTESVAEMGTGTVVIRKNTSEYESVVDGTTTTKGKTVGMNGSNQSKIDTQSTGIDDNQGLSGRVLHNSSLSTSNKT